MANPIAAYTRWLHTQWPGGVVEKLPETHADGSTNVPGVYVVGDLSGIPLLKFALDGGTRAVRAIVADPTFRGGAGAAPGGGPAGGGPSGAAGASADPAGARGASVAGAVSADPAGPRGPRGAGVAGAAAAVSPTDAAALKDLVIIGGGVAGMAAAVEARRQKLDFTLLESAEPFSTLVNFPKAKPIFVYPQGMTPAGDLHVSATVKEALIAELRAQTTDLGLVPTVGRAEAIVREGGRLVVRLAGGGQLAARRVIVAIGRSGEYRKLGVPGEQLDKVYNRLHDPKDHAGRNVLVVGGGDSALEAAIALAEAGARVTLSYRKAEFARPKAENVEKLDALSRAGALMLRLPSAVREIRMDAVDLQVGGAVETLPNDVVFTLIGREAPLAFLRRSGVRIAGEMTPLNWVMLGLFVLFCTWLYNWKSGGGFSDLWYAKQWFPTNLGELTAGLSLDPHGFLGIALKSATGPSFWYTLAYSTLVVTFGLRRIRRRKTPYVKAQTLTLMAVQVFPLFLFPEIIFPWLNYHGLLPAALADHLFPVCNYGHGREFWRAYGLILPWPLNVYNVITDHPLWTWLWIGVAQTFVIIPTLVYFWGKGAYCGWICSCGALAETLGDTHRHKMVHGKTWNRWNMFGQGVLLVALLILVVRILGWVMPGSGFDRAFNEPLHLGFLTIPGLHDSYKWTVDVFLAGIVGYGFYFWYSGRVWCRFMCPLAALMHIYARFSRFGIIAEKKKCISCNVCTSVCHQGIDIMSFANKGRTMQDPECVRCSACVQSCPTGVLTFGQVDRKGTVIARDRLAASPVQMVEGR